MIGICQEMKQAGAVCFKANSLAFSIQIYLCITIILLIIFG